MRDRDWLLDCAGSDDIRDVLRAFERAQRPRVGAAPDSSRQLAKLVFRHSEVAGGDDDLAAQVMPLRIALRPIRDLLKMVPAARGRISR